MTDSAAASTSSPLQPTPIPPLRTRQDVATLLDLPLRALTYTLYRRGVDAYYQTWEIHKKSGGVRTISAPRSTLYRVQTRLNAVLQEIYKPKPPVQGFVHGRSIVTNARPHVARRWVLNVDLEDFFPSINFGRVRGLFRARPLEAEPEAATMLAKICCWDDGLPIGAPTSPVVANMICLRMDGELQRLAQRRGCWYTRYADDLTFSTNRARFPVAVARVDDDGRAEIGDELATILSSNGFVPNARKTRLQGQGNRQAVTGVVVNKNLGVDRRFIRRIRAMLHAWDRYGLDAAQARFASWDSKDRYPGATPQFAQVLRGRISYLAMIRGTEDPIAVRFKLEFENLLAGRAIDAGLPPELLRGSWHADSLPSDPPATSSTPTTMLLPIDATRGRIDLAARMTDGTGESARDGRVSHAIQLFQTTDATREELRSAVVALAGVLEARRRLLKDELISPDEGALFQIANMFDLRHQNASQRTDYDPAFLDWLFWWYLATIELSDRLIHRQSGS